MQIKSKYIAILITIAIGVVVAISCSQSEENMSVCLWDKQEARDTYDIIPVDTTSVYDIAIDTCAIPCYLGNSGIAAYRDYIRRGSVSALKGKICVVQLFLNTPSDGWTEKERVTATNRVYEAEHWLEDKAADYGTDVDFCTVAFPKNYSMKNIPSEPCEDDNNDNLLHKAFRWLNWNDHDAFLDFIKEEYKCDGVIMLVMAKATGRSWSLPYTRSNESNGETDNFAEGAIIFNTSSYSDGSIAPLNAFTVAHEILHLCGAWDFYEEEGIQDREHACKAKQLFPDSIMLIEKDDIDECKLDEVTAWLVGLKEKKDWYAWFQPEA